MQTAGGDLMFSEVAQPLLDWASAREAIRLRKAAGEPGPWTNDPIFQTYRFCNVRRSDDRVSQWLIHNVLQPFYARIGDDVPLTDFLMFTAMCRWVNWPPTIQGILTAGLFPAKLPGKLDWTAIGEFVDARQKAGSKAWTGAYMVRAKPGDQQRGKGRFVTEDVIEKSLGPVVGILQEALLHPGGGSPSRQYCWSVLNGCLNWGSFMAGQVVADWGYIPLLKDAFDTNTWAPTGPGSKRGFNRLMGRPLVQKIPDEEWIGGLSVWRTQIISALGPGYDDLTLHDVQNCLCELDKYLRVLHGQGRPRAKYRPETAF